MSHRGFKGAALQGQGRDSGSNNPAIKDHVTRYLKEGGNSLQIIFVCLYNVGTVAKTCNLPNMKNFTIHLFKNKIIKIKAALKTLVQVQQKYLSSFHCLLLFSFDNFYDPPVQDYPNQSHLELFFTPTIHHSNKSIFSVAIVCCPFPLTTHTIV